MNNECGFWFWFIRPFAEITAGLAIAFTAIAIFVVYVILSDWNRDRKIRNKNDK